MFDIFDLTFSKIVDPTIFVRKSFIFAGNSLARRASDFFFARNSFARRTQFSRASRGRVHPASPRRARGGLVSRKTIATWGVRARQGVPRFSEYQNCQAIVHMQKCLVHQMPSLSKYISQIQNCWRANFKIFSKIQECKVQLHNYWRDVLKQ